MKISTRFLSFAALATVAAAAGAQTPSTPPAINWDPADVAVIYAADQEKFPEVFKDSKGNAANAWTAPAWGQTCVFSDDEAGDGAAVRIDNLDFLPLQVQATVDLSDYRFLHIDLWAQNDDKMSIKLQNWWPGESFSADVIDLKGGEWKSVDIDLDGANFTWSKKNEIPQHCINIIQLGGEAIPNDYPHSPAIYFTNLIAHNDASVLDPGAGIGNVAVDNAMTDSDTPVYNLFGQRVDKTYKGIVVSKGRKYIQK